VQGQDGLVKHLPETTAGTAGTGAAKKPYAWRIRKRSSRFPGAFEPVILPKHQKRTPLFNDQIISMYS
jgi:hypothetical protein